MAKIVGNDNDFPTIKQVNDALDNIFDKTNALDFYISKNVTRDITLSSSILSGFVIYNTNTNTFIFGVVQDNYEKYFAGWFNQNYFGTYSSKGGVSPIENKIYRETSTGKYYICKSEKLVELTD